ncbi:uncharacterized protein METZ01_LOCUS118504, partial [marine metagenome]
MTKRIKDPISFSQLAQDTILNFIGMQGEPAAVRISVASDSPLDPRYEVTLIDLDERGAEDFIFDGNGFEVLIDPKSLELLEGTRIDW